MTRQPIPYTLSAEALTLDEVAVRLRTTRETVEHIYDGPRFKFGRQTRVNALHLQAWMDRQADFAAWLDGASPAPGLDGATSDASVSPGSQVPRRVDVG